MRPVAASAAAAFGRVVPPAAFADPAFARLSSIANPPLRRCHGAAAESSLDGTAVKAPAPNSSRTGPGHAAQTTRSSAPTGCTGRGAAAGPEGGAPAPGAWWARRRARPAAGPLEEALAGELEAHAQGLLPREAHAAQKAEFLRGLERAIADVVDGAEVLPFGSVVNGFWTPQSDVDVCVRVSGASTRNAQIGVLKRIAGELARVASHHIEPRYGAQVPILHWAPQRPGMVSCDISINNDLAVVNSRLVGEYVKLDGRLRTLGMCLKSWAQARGINDRSRGTVSSFALVLMLIHFLQRRDPPVLPSLQDIAFSRSHRPHFVGGVDCRFCADPAEASLELEQARGGRPPNGESTGRLLVEFLRHFGHEYRCGVIRIRDTRSVLPPADESACYLVVDNPFEVGKDVANIDRSQHDAIRRELRRAWSLLSRGHSFRELLRSPALDEDDGRRRPLAWASNSRNAW